MSAESTLPASQVKKYTVTADDLPLSCPMPSMRLWDSHPRVYLPIEKTSKCVCPYCGAEYTLISRNPSTSK